MYTTLKLLEVEENRLITMDRYPDFFFKLQRGVLLSLKEDGKLTDIQYRNAEEILKEQRREVIVSGTEGGSAS